MQHTIILPDLGQTTSEAKVVRWLKRLGDSVLMGEPLLEVETDKATMEVEAYVGGYLREMLVGEGQVAAATAPIALLTDTLEEPYQSLSSDATGPPPAPQRFSSITPSEMPTHSAVRAVPAARSLASQLGIDLSSVTGTGPNGLIIKQDVERHVAQQGSSTPASPSDLGESESLFGMASIAPGGTSTISRVLTNERRLAMYRSMVLCRVFEERVNSLFLQGKMPGTIHQAIGQEACAVGVCEALEPGDMLTSTHRPHEHAVARGIPVKSLMAELFAKKTGCCGGKGGSMHIGHAELGMLPAIAIVGGGIPLATGYALSFKHLKKPNVVACFFGDGASNIGSFHEALNMAAIWDLPVLFICENNKYGASTPIHRVMKVKHVSDRASAYGVPGVTVDGNDVEEVYLATQEAAVRARAGAGPTLLELETYRFSGHSRSDPGHYRSKEEVAEWKKRDPIARFETACVAEGLLNRDLIQRIRAAVEQELNEAVAFAEESPSPLPEDCLADVYAE